MSNIEFLIRQREELVRARVLHPPMQSLHGGYAILLEEVDEFWDEVKKKDRDPALMQQELVQVAAMAQRIFEDVLGGVWVS